MGTLGKHWKMKEITKIRIGNANRGRIFSNEFKEKCRLNHLGKKLFEETKQKMREKKLSKEHIKKLKEANSGNKCYAWKGDSAGYGSIHCWIKKHYGKASKCENPNCSHKSKHYEWALLKGKKYSHNRNNFFMLCVSCHRKYDMTETTKRKIGKALRGRPPWNKKLYKEYLLKE